MSLDSNQGGILSDFKNLFAVDDTLTLGMLTACKHANGRDWWVIAHEYFTDRLYIVLVNPQGVQLYQSQHIGDIFFPFRIDDDGFQYDNDLDAQAVFSPDGAHYAFAGTNYKINLFDFDRCSGEFSNYKTDSIGCLEDALCATLGCSFSPDSRYLYLNTYQRIFQYDLDAPDFAASRIQVAKHDSANGPLYGWFFMNQLAPDNKIYLGTFNSIKYLHYIDQPDSPGLACNVIQHGLTLPTYNISVPNFPNYDLGPLQGSPCDTLDIADGVERNDSEFDFRVYPNPATWWLNIVYHSPQQAALFELFDLYGRRVAAVSLYHYFKNRMLDVSRLSAGVYEYRITSVKMLLQKGKVIVQKE